MGRKVFVIGVGMTKFEKPGSKDWCYPDMAREAGNAAIVDAKIKFEEIEQAAVGYCYGDSTAGERAFYELGHSGIPIYNVNNNCSTGSTALHMAKQFVEGGLAECAMALGFEKMEKGSLGIKYTDRTLALDKHFGVMNEQCGFDAAAPAAAQMFGNAGREHMERYGTNKDHFAKIGYKNHKHSVNNPYSQFQDEYTLEQIQGAPTVFDPLTKLQCCPTSDGSGAAIVASEAFVDSHGLRGQAVEILGMNMTTDFKSSFSGSMIQMVGSDMTKAGANKLYESTGFGPENVDVIELHDCFSANELITYEALGLCPEGKAGEFIDSEAQTYGGQVVVNPSGGLISKGHPLGATGLAQCAELTWQLRGTADKRQVADAKIALQHNLGLGGAAVLAMYRMAS